MNVHKKEAQKQWNTTPCGSSTISSDLKYGSLEYFDEIRRLRYENDDPWVIELIESFDVKDKKLCEIGFGMGTDLLEFNKRGAIVSGVDITNEHIKLAKANFELHNKNADLHYCESSRIDFQDETFDYVYSNGVLHHTNKTEESIAEAYRILKKGGKLILTLYNSYSAFNIFFMLIFQGILKGKLFTLGYAGLMSTVEFGADGKDIKPLVKTYSTKQMAALVKNFTHIEIKKDHFKREHIPLLGRLIPKPFEKYLSKSIGWYVIAIATK